MTQHCDFICFVAGPGQDSGDPMAVAIEKRESFFHGRIVTESAGVVRWENRGEVHSRCQLGLAVGLDSWWEARGSGCLATMVVSLMAKRRKLVNNRMKHVHIVVWI